MPTCLQTTLKESVNDSTLLKLGEFRFNVNSSNVLTALLQTLPNTTTTARIEGNGYFTDATGTANYGQNITLSSTNVYFSAGKYSVIVSSKYNVKGISTNGNEATYRAQLSFELEQFAGMANETVRLALTNTSGDISAFTCYPSNCALIDISQTNVEGELKSFSYLPQLTTLRIDKTNITGDTSELAGLTNLTTFTFTNCPNITGTWPLV